MDIKPVSGKCSYGFDCNNVSRHPDRDNAHLHCNTHSWIADKHVSLDVTNPLYMCSICHILGSNES